MTLIFVKKKKQESSRSRHTDSLRSCFRGEVLVETSSWKTIFFSRRMEVSYGNLEEIWKIILNEAIWLLLGERFFFKNIYRRAININMHFPRAMGFPGGSDGTESSSSAGDLGSIPESGRPPGEGNGNPLQYSCLENSMNRGAWWAIQSTGLHRVGHN